MQIRISRKLITKSVAKGATLRKPKNPTPAIDHTKDPNILDRACPASIFANKRIDKLKTRTL
jgi:hypothetical protein